MNPRPTDYESVALPTAPLQHTLVLYYDKTCLSTVYFTQRVDIFIVEMDFQIWYNNKKTKGDRYGRKEKDTRYP